MNLGKNKISDINVLEKVNFKELKELDLEGNNISDISVFEKIKFEKLEVLWLEDNLIDSEKNTLIIKEFREKLRSFSI